MAASRSPDTCSLRAVFSMKVRVPPLHARRRRGTGSAGAGGGRPRGGGGSRPAGGGSPPAGGGFAPSAGGFAPLPTVVARLAARSSVPPPRIARAKPALEAADQ